MHLNIQKANGGVENNPKVAKVNHPAVPSHPDHELYKKLFPNGGGSIFTFDIKGGEKGDIQKVIMH